MPELPEVETIARRLRETTRGLAIRSVEVFDSKLDHLLGEQSPLDATIRKVVRRGKFLALLLDDDRVLLMHMMMSGRILVRQADDPPDRYLRAAFTLDGQTQIRFSDPRRFGTARVIGPAEYRDFPSAPRNRTVLKALYNRQPHPEIRKPNRGDKDRASESVDTGRSWKHLRRRGALARAPESPRSGRRAESQAGRVTGPSGAARTARRP